MGSMITLRLGRLEVDWGKNSFFINHSALFRSGDLAEADYFYEDDIVERKPAYVRKLRHVVPRLELLGFSLEGCRRAYEEEVRRIPASDSELPIDFDTFRRALQIVDVDRIRISEYEGNFDPGEFAQAVLRDPVFDDVLPASLTRDGGIFLENLNGYVILRLLAENPANLDRDLVWSIDDVVAGGWVEGDIFEPLADASRFLIVTEGSSDSVILRAALPLVAPAVDDFFDFIDMRDNYPFTGTGNLVNFCKGLVAIRVQNKIVVVLDNDTAGQAAMQKLQRLRMPPNIRLVRLPDLESFRAFQTIGPSGRIEDDVNGRAVSIECFLDLAFGPKEERAVRWTSFNHEVGTYQGELLAKEEYTKRFFEELNNGSYDLSKLHLLWSHILRACVTEAVPS
ncbi:HEPN/Toprim-associated domain-containing protein (plasmid) [Pararoseomonas sp. SCSIO 73927]|uniref:HEPN/Toprim-associated domain-containing protein n=1 Tax=Pararoseomonas sp. SCSIO 73927 TaxID=3114537 RepID=UPI0030CBD814